RAPTILEKLRANVELHRINARLFNCGVSNVGKAAQITYYPRASAMSGLYAKAQEDAQTTRTFLANQDAALAVYAEDFLEGRFASQSFPCQLKSLSEVISENHVERIDLLKIDVEKSELDVLQGIAEGDWKKIRQITIEVHDI